MAAAAQPPKTDRKCATRPRAVFEGPQATHHVVVEVPRGEMVKRQRRGWARTLPEPLRQEPLGDRTVWRAGTLTMLSAVPPIRQVIDEAPSIDPSLVRHAPPKSDHSFARHRPEVKRFLAGPNLVPLAGSQSGAQCRTGPVVPVGEPRM